MKTKGRHDPVIGPKDRHVDAHERPNWRYLKDRPDTPSRIPDPPKCRANDEMIRTYNHPG